MKSKLIINVARSLLMARLKQTLVAAIGVTFGITMFITLLSFMNGLNHMLDSLIVNRTPHIRLFKEIKPTKVQPIQRSSSFKNSYNFINSIKPKAEPSEIRNNSAIIKWLKKDPRVLGVAPKITTPVFYNVGAIELTGIINGIDVMEENKLFLFSDYVTYGNYIDLKNIPNSIILGKAAADKMLVNIGDIIQVTTNKGTRMSLKVVGYFQSGLTDIDKVQSYTSLNTAQKLMGVPSNYITGIQIKLKNIELAPEMAKESSLLFETDATDIQTANAQFDVGTRIRSMISYAVGVTLLIVAGFGIYNILNMMIYEKMDSIAILKATGFSGSDVRAIFLTIALSIGLFGALMGMLWGYILTSIIDQIPFKTEALPTITTFPIDFNMQYYITAGIFAIATTYFAGYFPSKKASKMDPVIIIRGK